MDKARLKKVNIISVDTIEDVLKTVLEWNGNGKVFRTMMRSKKYG